MKTDKNKFLKFFNLNNTFLIFCLILFSLFLIKTLKMQYASSYLLPRMLCVFGIVIIVIMLLMGYLKEVDIAHEKEEEGIGVHPALAIAFATAYFFANYYLGFILGTCIAIITFSYLMKFQNKKAVYILAVLIPLVLHYAFVTFLKASMPRGIVEKLFF